MSGRITVIAGPTAVGKGTLVRALAARYPQVWVSISATTRAPRPGEVDGEAYFFVTAAQFDHMVDADEFVEWAVVHGEHKYGTPRRALQEALAAGRIPVLEIDLDGARQVRASLPTAHFIFVAPPDFATLSARLAQRGTEDQAERDRRLATARIEMQAQSEFDDVIINDDLEVALADLAQVMGLSGSQTAAEVWIG